MANPSNDNAALKRPEARTVKGPWSGPSCVYLWREHVFFIRPSPLSRAFSLTLPLQTGANHSAQSGSCLVLSAKLDAVNNKLQAFVCVFNCTAAEAETNLEQWHLCRGNIFKYSPGKETQICFLRALEAVAKGVVHRFGIIACLAVSTGSLLYRGCEWPGSCGGGHGDLWPETGRERPSGLLDANPLSFLHFSSPHPSRIHNCAKCLHLPKAVCVCLIDTYCPLILSF